MTSSWDDFSLQLDHLGLAGTSEYIIVRPHYRDPSDSRNLGGPAGLPGQYKAIFVLSRPGFPLLPEYQYRFAEKLEGDSHLAITKPAYSHPDNPGADQIELEAQTPEGRFVFTGHPNSKGFLGKMELGPFSADSIGDAGLKAQRALASGLSIISVCLDIPLYLCQTEITELRTGSVSMSMSVPYTGVPFLIPTAGSMTDEFRGYASLYREALNSNSPNLQFLCYYKIIEGTRKRRARRIREANARGEAIQSSAKQIIPAEHDEQINWLNSIYPLPRTWDDATLAQIFPQRALSRKISDVVDNEIRGIRNRIAHFILDTGELTILTDEGKDLSVVNEWLPLTKCIARFLIKAEFPDAFKR